MATQILPSAAANQKQTFQVSKAQLDEPGEGRDRQGRDIPYPETHLCLSSRDGWSRPVCSIRIAGLFNYRNDSTICSLVT